MLNFLSFKLSYDRKLVHKVEVLGLTLIGMRGDTFISLSFLDQILSADFLSKLSKLFEGENLQLQRWTEHATLIFKNLKPVEISKSII